MEDPTPPPPPPTGCLPLLTTDTHSYGSWSYSCRRRALCTKRRRWNETNSPSSSPSSRKGSFARCHLQGPFTPSVSINVMSRSLCTSSLLLPVDDTGNNRTLTLMLMPTKIETCLIFPSERCRYADAWCEWAFKAADSCSKRESTCLSWK